jgi:ribosome production factor 1
VHSYIFETKESKQSDSKGKKGKDGKGEKISQQKVIARLQVMFPYQICC